MRHLFRLFILLFIPGLLYAQDFVFTFNAKDASNTIDSIKATKIETGETAFVEGSNIINMSSFTTRTQLSPTNPEEITVYPNPFENVTHLKFYSTQNDNIKVSLVNTAGQVVAEKKQNITSGIHQFKISTNDHGLYILNITGNYTKFSQKIISTKKNQSQPKIEYSGYSLMALKKKSAKNEEGKLIFFYVYSGDNITKIANSPTESKSYEVEFYKCKDADGKNYPIVQIGDQWWMTENLACDTGSGSWAYNNDVSNVATYGRLYNWETALIACPSGWHLPSDNEWDQLAQYVSDQMGPYNRNEERFIWENVGTHLKATSGWKENGNGTDNFGFSGRPGGFRTLDGKFDYKGYGANWWSSTEYNNNEAWSRFLGYAVNVFSWSRYDKRYGWCIRCIKD